MLVVNVLVIELGQLHVRLVRLLEPVAHDAGVVVELMDELEILALEGAKGQGVVGWHKVPACSVKGRRPARSGGAMKNESNRRRGPCPDRSANAVGRALEQPDGDGGHGDDEQAEEVTSRHLVSNS